MAHKRRLNQSIATNLELTQKLESAEKDMRRDVAIFHVFKMLNRDMEDVKNRLKKIKILGINLMKGVKDLFTKLLKGIKEDLKKMEGLEN